MISQDILHSSRRIILTLLSIGILIWINLPILEAFPVGPVAERRMVFPPSFPYGAPYGYRSSALLCFLLPDVPYFGGWAGRSCAGPVAPFVLPTPPTTPTPASSSATGSQQMSGSSLTYSFSENPDNDPDQFADYGDPIEGNPWEPDDDDIFLETYGVRAAKPGFRLGDPHRLG